MDGIECHGFVFYNQFDSANLNNIEFVPQDESATPVIQIKTKKGIKKVEEEKLDAEFNLWTKKDCQNTEFENNNRTWFYFGMKAPASQFVKLNFVDLQRQGKMFTQGMAPVYRIIPGKNHWERIREKPTSSIVDDIFTMSFKYRTPENTHSVTYFAFTYPFSYTDLKKYLGSIDSRFLDIPPRNDYDIYYARETICYSLQNREVTLITISSHHGITNQREPRLKNLFPDVDTPRPFKFTGKKTIFVSSRVHPGETPGTFVFNGLLNLLLTREDPLAANLRKLYVFKMIPFLNPDGVALGHYRTDTRGVNLNRVYLNPSIRLHPPIYAARALIRYYHYGYEKEDIIRKCKQCAKLQDGVFSDHIIHNKVSAMSLEEEKDLTNSNNYFKCDVCGKIEQVDECDKKDSKNLLNNNNQSCDSKECDSGLFLYIDLHGHASKKGIFMYGNHFKEMDQNVECWLLPKLMSINNSNFHFTACNFTEKNMYTRDKRDGMSREGSGRVAVFKLTGLIKSYTLECNYNTGRMVNILPPSIRELYIKNPVIIVPPKYNPQIFEEVGRSLGASILDLTGSNPCTRLPNSEYHSLSGVRDKLREYCAKELDDFHLPSERKKKANVQGSSQVNERHYSAKMASKKMSITTKTRPNTVPTANKKNILYRPTVSCIQGVARQKSNAARAKSIANIVTKKPSIKIKTSKRSKSSNVLHQSSLIPKVKILSQSFAVIEQTYKNTTEGDRLKLKEICLVKDTETNKEVGNTDTNWQSPNSNLQVLPKSSKIPSTNLVSFISSKTNSEAGPSKQPEFLDQNFGKNTNFCKTKFKKHLLRRLANAESVGKVDKVKKRRKLKAK